MTMTYRDEETTHVATPDDEARLAAQGKALEWPGALHHWNRLKNIGRELGANECYTAAEQLAAELYGKSRMIQAQAGLRAHLQKRADEVEARLEILSEIDAKGYATQGAEVSAIAEAIREGRPYVDDGTFMEAARDALNKLMAAGFIVMPTSALSDLPTKDSGHG